MLVLFWHWYLERGVQNADIVDVAESDERDLLLPQAGNGYEVSNHTTHLDSEVEMENLTATNAMESIVTQISHAIHPYGTIAETPHPAASLPDRSADSTEIEYTPPPLINNQSKYWLLTTQLLFGPFLLVWLTWAGRRSPLPSKASSSFQQFQSAPRLS